MNFCDLVKKNTERFVFKLGVFSSLVSI